MTKPRTRLAPSPTGALHLGNARTFLINWALAKQRNWTVALRIEDLDTPRTKLGADQQAIDMLHWLGITGLEPPIVQSAQLEPYQTAMRTLADQRLIFRCDLTRREIEMAASAPQEGEITGQCENRFPPSLRPTDPAAYQFDPDCRSNYRFVTNEKPIQFHDQIHGPQKINTAADVGDFVVWTQRQQPAYQLAVVVDDIRQGVTDVVRGDDLLSSVARQTLIYQALDAPPPKWWHVPLVVGPDGRRLAKRHGDSRLITYRRAGVCPERIIGLIASYSGICPDPVPMCLEEFTRTFSFDRLPTQQVTFTEESHRWLLADSLPS